MGRPSPVRRGLSVLFPFDLSRVGCLWPACVCLLQGGRRKGILVSNASSSSSPLISCFLYSFVTSAPSPSPLLHCPSLTGRQKSMRGFHTDPGEVMTELPWGTEGWGVLGWPSVAWVSVYHLNLSVVPDHSWAGPSGANSDENTEDPPWTPGKNLCHALGDRLKVHGWPLL